MREFWVIILFGSAVMLADPATADFRNGRQGRRGRQRNLDNQAITGGIDFSNAVFDQETGKRCVIKEAEVESIEKEPILECTHKNVEKCHYTYVTQFSPAQEEVCEENFEKTCQITFKQQALTESVKKCYRPLEKVCNGQGPEECRTVYESACSTRYIEKKPGKFVGDTKCEKLPVEICGRGCETNEGAEECHDKKITSLIDVPEEVCDLNPQKTCRLQTKLVPSLKPEHECTIVPQEICNLKFTTPKLKKKPLLTKWCLDESPSPPGDSYDESNSRGNPIRSGRTLELPQRNRDRSINARATGESSEEDADKDIMDEAKKIAAQVITPAKAARSLRVESFADLPFKTQQFTDFTDVSNVGPVRGSSYF